MIPQFHRATGRRVGRAHHAGGKCARDSQAGGPSPPYHPYGLSAGSSALWIGICAFVIVLSSTLFAQETGPAEPLTVDDQTVEPAEPPEAAPTPLEQDTEDVPELAARIVAEMRDAQARLVDGQLDEDSVELQDRISEDLTKLLEALEQQASQPAPVPGEDAQQPGPGQDTSSTGGAGDPAGQPGDGSADGESTEGDRTGSLSEAELEHRRNLATSVWGHLPERERDEMLGAFSERFLPAYDELVRRYYESLATQGRRER